MINANAIIGSHDCLLLTLDTLRLDAAREALARRQTPHLQSLLPAGRWEERHSPATFTYAAHCAFFAGFLPTPAVPGRHPRLLAARFAGSETTTPETLVFDAPDIVSGFAAAGYHTACIGGVGFFNKQTPLGSVLPKLFAESHWSPELGVTSSNSAAAQIALAVQILNRTANKIFLFINISAIHQPNCIFTPGAAADSVETQINALAHVDSKLPPLFDALAHRGSSLVVLCSDHGTAYGEDGYHGHRLAHPSVFRVPYAEFIHPGHPPIAGQIT